MESQLRQIPGSLPEILAYKNDRMLKRYMIDNGQSAQQADRCFKALKEFLVVCAVKPGAKITSDPIDNMWHTFLMFTKDYRKFCQEFLGRYVDHEPFENAAPGTYLQTRDFAAKYFGDIDDELWPANAKGDCSSGCEE